MNDTQHAEYIKKQAEQELEGKLAQLPMSVANAQHADVKEELRSKQAKEDDDKELGWAGKIDMANHQEIFCSTDLTLERIANALERIAKYVEED